MGISRAQAAVNAAATATQAARETMLAEAPAEAKETDAAAATTATDGDFDFVFTSKPLGLSLTMKEEQVVVKKVKRKGTPIAGGDQLIALGGKDVVGLKWALKDVF